MPNGSSRMLSYWGSCENFSVHCSRLSGAVDWVRSRGALWPPFARILAKSLRHPSGNQDCVLV